MATGARPLWKPAAIYAHNRDTSQFPRDRKKRSSLLTTEWKWGGRGPKIPPICRTRDPTCSTILRHDMLVAALSRRLRCRSLDVSAKLAAPEYKRTRRTVPANADSGSRLHPLKSFKVWRILAASFGFPAVVWSLKPLGFRLIGRGDGRSLPFADGLPSSPAMWRFGPRPPRATHSLISFAWPTDTPSHVNLISAADIPAVFCSPRPSGRSRRRASPASPRDRDKNFKPRSRPPRAEGKKKKNL